MSLIVSKNDQEFLEDRFPRFMKYLSNNAEIDLYVNDCEHGQTIETYWIHDVDKKEKRIELSNIVSRLDVKFDSEYNVISKKATLRTDILPFDIDEVEITLEYDVIEDKRIDNYKQIFFP